MSEAQGELVSKKVAISIEQLLQEMGLENCIWNISPAVGHGVNYLGVVAKVQVGGEDKNGKTTAISLIVKSAPRQEGFRKFAPVRPAYDREIYMYTKVLPEFIKLQQEKGIKQPFKSFAKYYKSTMDPFDEAVIMENMKDLGFELRDHHQPLDYSHVALVVKEYAKLHALSYAVRDQKPELFKQLSENTEESFYNNEEVSDTMTETILQLADRALNSLDPVKDKEAYEKFKNFRGKLGGIIKPIVRSAPAGEYAVIGHGDSYMNNLLFKYEDPTNPHSPTELCLLDWQLARLGSPALDLAYFIFICTDKTLRDQHYDHLMREYYDSFSSFLRELGSDPERMFPFKIFQEHLKKFSVHGLYMAIWIIYLLTCPTDEIPDVSDSSNDEAVKEKFTFTAKNEDAYYKRIRDVILDYINYGYEI